MLFRFDSNPRPARSGNRFQLPWCFTRDSVIRAGVFLVWFTWVAFVMSQLVLLSSLHGVGTIIKNLLGIAAGLGIGFWVYRRVSMDTVAYGFIGVGGVGLAAVCGMMALSPWKIGFGQWTFAGLGLFSIWLYMPLKGHLKNQTGNSPGKIRWTLVEIFSLALAIAMAAVSWFMYGTSDTLKVCWTGLAIAHGWVGLYGIYLYPEYILHLLAKIILNIMYRIEHRDMDRIPSHGPAVLVCNHVAYTDSLIIGSVCRRPVRFVIMESMYRLPVLHYLIRAGKAIPVRIEKPSAKSVKKMFDQIAHELEDGQLVCIFPEGKMTTNGQVDTFKSGIERIVQRTPVPVIPLAIEGLWGSCFSHKDGHALTKWPSRFRARISLAAAPAVMPEHVSAETLHQIVTELKSTLEPTKET